MKNTIFKSFDYLSLKSGIRPKVLSNKAPNILQKEKKGGVVISADFELAWAFRYSKKVLDPIKMAQQTRNNFPIYLKLFDEYEIPITWATVGHLMLEKCNKGDHDWMKRLPYFNSDHKWSYSSGDWFDCDPYTSVKKDNSWYAPDLIEKILNANTRHEIACHTFSHVDFSDANCPQEVAEDELKACIEAAKSWGIELKSMVFPGGTFGNLEALKKFGFEIYRKNISSYKLSLPFKDSKKLYVTASSLGLGGIIENEASFNYHFFRIKKYIEKAIKTNTVCHLWFHPSVSPNYVTNIFPRITEYISELRSSNYLWIGTMSDLSKNIYIND